MKYLLFLSDLKLMKMEFSLHTLKAFQISKFMKIRPLRTELFRADGRTDGETELTKLIVAFRNFAKAPKKYYSTLPISRSPCTVSLSSRLSSRQLYHTHSSQLPAYPATDPVPDTIKHTYSSNKTRTFTALKLRDGSLWISQKPRTVLH